MLLRKIFSIFLVLSFLTPTLITTTAATWPDDIIYTTFSETEIPADPAALAYQRFMCGSAGGVHVFQDTVTQQKYALKTWASVGHCISEKLGALLLQKLGVPIPKFCLLKTLPDSFKKINMAKKFLEGNFFCLSEFIEGFHPAEQFITSYLTPYFSAIAFVGCHDYHRGNLIIDENNSIFLIDTGGALLHSVTGKLKKDGKYWLSHEIKELDTFCWGQDSLSFDQCITDDLIRNQLEQILKRAEIVLQTADDFCVKFQYPDREKIMQMLYARLNYAQKYVAPTAQPLSFNLPILNREQYGLEAAQDLFLPPIIGRKRKLSDATDIALYPASKFCASEHMFARIKRQKKLADDLPFPETLASIYPEIQLNPAQIHLIRNRILAKENAHPDDFVVYHGLRSDVWFYYRVLSVLFHTFNETAVQTDVLRSVDLFFQGLPDAQVLGKNSYAPGVQRCLLSGNPTFFSNFSQIASSTFHYFFTNFSYSPPSNPENIFVTMLEFFKVSQNSIKKVMENLAPLQESLKTEGCLLQFFFTENALASTCSISGPMGHPILNKQFEFVTDTVNILTRLRQGNDVHDIEDPSTIEIQFRANLNPIRDQVRVYDYFSSATDHLSAGLDQQIFTALMPIFTPICKELARNIAVYGEHAPRLQQHLRERGDVQPWEYHHALSPICQAYEQNNILEIWHLLQENPHLLGTRYLQNPDKLKWIELENTYVKFLTQITEPQVQILSSFIDHKMAPSDVLSLLMVVIQGIPDIKDRDNVLMYAQQCKTKKMGHVKPLISAISKVPREFRERVIGNAKKCIREKMDGTGIAQIIRRIYTIDPEVCEDILDHAQQCITDQMSGWDVVDLLTTIQEIDPENRAGVISAVYELMSNHDIGGVRGNILELVNNIEVQDRASVIFYAKQCITEKTRAIDIADIVRRIHKIPENCREDVVAWSNTLIAKTKIDGSSIDLMMKEIHKIRPENRSDILELAIQLIVPRMNGEGTAKIIKKIRQIPFDDLDTYEAYVQPKVQLWCRVNGIISGAEISEKIVETMEEMAQMISETEDSSKSGSEDGVEGGSERRSESASDEEG